MADQTGADTQLMKGILSSRVGRRELLRRAALLGLGASGIASLLAACGGDAATPSPATGSSSGTAGTVTSTESPSAEQPQRGGTLIVALESDPSSFDPAYTSVPGRRVGRAIYDALVDVTLDGEIVPGLLEKWEIVDNKTFIFYARPGVKFHDGSDFDGAAIKLHFERHFDPDVKSLRRSERTAG